MSPKIERRDDVSPKEGLREYGDVEFADSTNKKYPIDTPEHIRAAWTYINHKDNAAKYDADEVKASLPLSGVSLSQKCPSASLSNRWRLKKIPHISPRIFPSTRPAPTKP